MNRTHKATLALSPLLLAFCMGSTDCDAYQHVTVPASDATAPDTFDGVWWDGTYLDLGDQSVNITYHIALGESVIAVGSGLDQGGVKKVDMRPSIAWTCCSGNVCSTTQSLMATITDSQGGGVGSSVSNGIWVGTEVTLPATGNCQAGYALKSWTYQWTTAATNYHGKVRISPVRKIVYP